MKKELRDILDQALRSCVYMQALSNVQYYVKPAFANRDLFNEELTEDEANNLPVIREARASIDTLVREIVRTISKLKKSSGKQAGKNLHKKIILDEIKEGFPPALWIALQSYYGSTIDPNNYQANNTTNFNQLLEEIKKTLSPAQRQRLRKLIPGIAI